MERCLRVCEGRSYQKWSGLKCLSHLTANKAIRIHHCYLSTLATFQARLPNFLWVTALRGKGAIPAKDNQVEKNNCCCEPLGSQHNLKPGRPHSSSLKDNEKPLRLDLSGRIFTHNAHYRKQIPKNNDEGASHTDSEVAWKNTNKQTNRQHFPSLWCAVLLAWLQTCSLAEPRLCEMKRETQQPDGLRDSPNSKRLTVCGPPLINGGNYSGRERASISAASSSGGTLLPILLRPHPHSCSSIHQYPLQWICKFGNGAYF